MLQRSRSVQRTSSALALARKITMANNRRKKAEAVAQEAGLQSPSSFIPRSPVQQYPYFSWRQKGDCLSSTKVKEAILFIKTVTCKRRSKHGPITRGLTFFLCSLCLVSFLKHEVLRVVVLKSQQSVWSAWFLSALRNLKRWFAFYETITDFVFLITEKALIHS